MWRVSQNVQTVTRVSLPHAVGMGFSLCGYIINVNGLVGVLPLYSFQINCYHTLPGMPFWGDVEIEWGEGGVLNTVTLICSNKHGAHTLGDSDYPADFSLGITG